MDDIDSDLLEGLRQAVLEAGLDLFGVTSAEPLDLREPWRHVQPRELLPGARSVVLAGFGATYEPRPVPSEPGIPRGWFPPFGSRVFEQMCDHAVRTIREYLEARGYQVLDGYEIAVKPAVVRSGLARYGRHNVTINPTLGSMVMYAAAVTDAPLATPETDSPLYAEICPPDCRLCADACPTGALSGNYEIDRSRCITNWLWGAYSPRDLRPHQENRLFGCGLCLWACPANTGVGPRTSHPVPVDSVDDGPELIPIAAGDREYYEQHVPTFPKQAGLNAMRGGAIVALGNIADPASVDVLASTIRAGDAQLRAYSAWALGRLGTERSRAILAEALEAEEDSQVTAEIEAAL